MPQYKVSRSQLLQGRVVDEKLAAKYDALALRSGVAALGWRDKNPTGLPTAYGMLEVTHRNGGWIVRRDDDPLVQAGSVHPVLFPNQRVARAAGLIHLQDNFGDAPPWKDGLRWDRQPAPDLHGTPVNSGNTSLPDDHEWGRQELRQLLLDKVGANTSVADGHLVSKLERIAQAWELAPPVWNRRGEGHFELKTPYGRLTVSRLVGWKVERNGTPLVHVYPNELVIFDKLEHAKTCALRHVRGRYVGDGTQWGFDEPVLRSA
jgi:hypothetical protein